jgi:GNAT superfamily N-acetyltransferase
MMSDLVLRSGTAADTDRCAAMVNAWIDATPWMPRVHPPEDLARHYREWVVPNCAVIVAHREGCVAGFATIDSDGFLAGLFVAEAARGRGIGAALLEAAKARARGLLTLWTFEANHGARRFYARHGFVEAGRTDGENDEGLPDVLLEWRAPG